MTMCRKSIIRTVAAARLWCVYHQCGNAPLDVFIAYSDGDKKALRRRLFPSQQTIEIAGVMLQMEFAALCGEKVNMFPGKQALKLRLLIAQLQELLNIHAKSKKHRPQIEQKILALTHSNSLKNAQQLLKHWANVLQIEEAKLENEAKKNSNKDIKIEDLVVETSKYLGYPIDRKRPVSEFAGQLKSFKRYIAAQEKTNRKSAGKRK